MMRNRTRIALAGVAVVAAAAPAFADTVVVNASATASSRQLKVLDMAGNPLTSVSLSPGKGQPFQVQVVDSGFSNLTTGNNFSVSATMNNLYKATGSSSWDYATDIPSSDLSIDYQTNPIRAFSPVASVLGSVSLTGSLPTCSLTSGITGLTGVLADITTADGAALANQLCTELGATALQVSSAGPVALPSATSVDLSSLLPSDLPFNLGSTLGTDYQKGAFTNADYSSGTIGGSTSNTHIPSGWASNVTSIQLLSGHAGLTTALTNTLTSALSAVISGNSTLSSATGSGALLPVSSVVAALNNAGGSLTTLAGTLSQIPADDAAQIVNSLAPALVTPVLSNLTGVGGTSVSLPILNYSGATTVPAGNYQGTMTVTLLSQ